MMNTPICDFVKKYADRSVARLHMPGHKGNGPLGFEGLDITEIEGADVLYSPSGIIAESQNNASRLFDSGKTLYSTEGSSLSIRAMLYLALLYGKSCGRNPIVLAARNVHKSFISAAALLDFSVEWLYSEESEGEGAVSCKLSAEQINLALSNMSELPIALYITSPDYLGNVADIENIAKTCHSRGVLLLVDNAHGAYLGFLPQNEHPITLGADLCCDSAHKTLPTLTGGAYLHISKSAPKLFLEMAEEAMSLFASTSPSYLILQSLDATNLYLAQNYREKLEKTADLVASLKQKLKKRGFSLAGQELIKLTIEAKSYGYYGYELARILLENNIYCEFSDPDFLVMMFSPEIDEKQFSNIEKILLSIEKREAITLCPPRICRAEKAISIREALLSSSLEIATDLSEGKILANANLSCPPAIPIAVCGERIDTATIKALKYYGIDKVRVVK